MTFTERVMLTSVKNKLPSASSDFLVEVEKLIANELDKRAKPKGPAGLAGDHEGK